MEKKRRLLQRGAADLVSVAVGMTLLAIAAVGTSYSLLYGRQALIHQEHYKVATYLLRGELEKEVARLQIFNNYRTDPSATINFNTIEVNLDNPNDREGEVQETWAEVDRVLFQPVNRIETGDENDFYQIAMKIKWTEAVYAGALGGRTRHRDGPTHEITMATTFLVWGEI